MKFPVTTLVIATALLTAPALGRAQERNSGFFTELVSLLDVTSDKAPSSPQQPGCSSPSCSGPVGCCDPVPYGAGCYAEDFCCSDGSCGDCCGCCCQSGFFGSLEFLAWWAKGTSLPPLVTTSPVGTPQVAAGVLGFQTTTILFGNELVGDQLQAGGRVTFGRWLDCEHNVAAVGRFWALGGDNTRFAATSTDFPILAIPFFDAALGVESAALSGFPALTTGSVAVNATNQNVFGVDALGEIMMERDCNRRIDLVAGYQFLRLDDSLQIDSTQNVLANLTTFDLTDRFVARNEFHGAQVGLRGRMARGCWSFDGLGKIGIGDMRQEVDISGQTVTTILNQAPTTVARALFAQPSNIGVYQRDVLVFIPEMTLNLTYHINCCLSMHMGYNLIWISNTVNTGDHLDRRVNLAQPVPPALPEFAFNGRDYWLQGMNFGVNWCY